MLIQLKYWEILLKKWREEGNDGLTIPFIIGCRKYFENEDYLYNVENIIEDIIENGTKQLYIKYCWNINAVIIGVWDETKAANVGEFLLFNNLKQDRLFVTKFLADKWESDLNNGVKDLDEKYGDFITKGSFSIKDGKWGPFNSSDMEFINRCLR